MKHRVLWSVLVISGLALGSSAAAADPDPAAARPADSAEADAGLVVWDWTSGEEDWQNYIDEAKADFAEKYPGVDVEVVIQPFDQYYTLIGNATQTGSGPDIMLFNGGGQILDRTSSLLPLNDYLADDLERLTGWEAFTDSDGQIFGSPINLQGHPIYYNREIYERAGLDPDSPPTTWDDLVDACEAIGENTDASCFATGNQEGHAVEFWLSGLGSGSLPAEEYDDWIAGDRDWTSPNVRRLLESWAEAGDLGFNNAGPNSTPMFADIFGTFQAGEAAHIIGLMSGIGHWKDFDEFLGPENVGVMPAPVLNPDAVPSLAFDGGIGYAVAESTEHPELAAEMVRSLSSTSALAVLFADAGMFVADTTIDMTDVGPAAATINAELASGKPALHVALSSDTQALMQRLGQQLLDGSVTVDEALEQLAEVDQAS